MQKKQDIRYETGRKHETLLLRGSERRTYRQDWNSGKRRARVKGRRCFARLPNLRGYKKRMT